MEEQRIQSLEEAEAERQTQQQESTDINTYISDIRVQNNSVQYQTLDSNVWIDLCSIKSVPDYNLDIQSEELATKYEMLQNVVESAYDEEKDMWKVEYGTYDNGEMKSLYVPLGSRLTDDIHLYDIHNSDGNVKQELKNMPIPIPELETRDLYVDNLPSENEATIHTDVEVSYNNRFKASLINNLKPFISSVGLLVLTIGALLYSTYILGILLFAQLAALAVSSHVFMPPIRGYSILPNNIVIEEKIIRVLKNYVSSIRRSTPNKNIVEILTYFPIIGLLILTIKLYNENPSDYDIKQTETTELFEI